MRILQSLSIDIGPQILDHNWLQSAFHDVKAYFYIDIVCKNVLRKFAVRENVLRIFWRKVFLRNFKM